MNFVDLKLWILVLWWREEFDQDCPKTPKIVVVLWQSKGKKSIALKYVIFYFRNFWWIIKIFRKKEGEFNWTYSQYSNSNQFIIKQKKAVKRTVKISRRDNVDDLFLTKFLNLVCDIEIFLYWNYELKN